VKEVTNDKVAAYGFYNKDYSSNVATVTGENSEATNAEDAKAKTYDYKAALESAAVAEGSTYNSGAQQPTVGTDWNSLMTGSGSYTGVGDNAEKAFSAYSTTETVTENGTTQSTTPESANEDEAVVEDGALVQTPDNTTTEGGEESNASSSQTVKIGDKILDISSAKPMPRFTLAAVTADGFDTEAGDYGNGWNQNVIDFDIIDERAYYDKQYNANPTYSTVYLHVTVSATEGNSEEETPATVRRREASLNTEDSSDNGDNTFEMGDVSAVLVNSGNISTGVENVMIDANVTVNYENDVIYDLYGRRVANPGTGIYIVNGRKMVIKR
jgi:hypothetical protein